MDFSNHACLLCTFVSINRKSFGMHLSYHHKNETIKSYTIQHELNGIIPTCKCGCGNLVSWHKTKYKFNSYITGHNDAGFSSTNQPKLSKKQIDGRNKKIKAAYKNNGIEIKKKISKSVIKGLKNSTFDFSSFRKNMWQEESFKEKQYVSRVKSWQDEAGEIRKEKVFTPEFGRKISISNMNRDVHRKSKAEEAFANKLKSIGLNIEESKWFNFTEKTWCADVWLPDQKIIIEFDGTYWHGLDRKEDFTLNQISNLTNDISKNLLAKNKRLSLLRINESSNWQDIKDLRDLVSLAYHVIRDGVVLKEGTFKLDDKTILIARDTLLRTHFTENGSKNIEETYFPIIEDFLVSHVAYWGWFYPSTIDDLSKVLSSLCEVGRRDKIMISNFGSTWLKSKLKSFWGVDDGPVATFSSKKARKSVLYYRLGLNNSKPYDYVLSSGEKVTFKETFDITLKTIRTGFVVQRNKVSWFKPAIASSVYNKFLKGIEHPIVWDPSVGFSARMLGFSALFEHGKYIGTEPAQMTFKDANMISSEILELKPNLSFDLYNIGSEKVQIEPESLDFVFTSPPYFDTEKYFNEPGQCWKDYSNLDSWVENYLIPTFKTSYGGLKHERSMVINISEKYKEVITLTAIKCGFKFVDEFSININADHFSRARGLTKSKVDLYLVFKK